MPAYRPSALGPLMSGLPPALQEVQRFATAASRPLLSFSASRPWAHRPGESEPTDPAPETWAGHDAIDR